MLQGKHITQPAAHNGPRCSDASQSLGLTSRCWLRHGDSLKCTICTKGRLVHAPKALWCMHQRPSGACTKGRLVHAPKAAWCKQYIGKPNTNQIWTLHHPHFGACTTARLVHAPQPVWCMHRSPAGACTTAHVVRAPQPVWCIPKLGGFAWPPSIACTSLWKPSIDGISGPGQTSGVASVSPLATSSNNTCVI